MTSRLEQPGGERAGQPLRPSTPRLHALPGDRAGPRPDLKPRALVVAGMHRSGTSALTRALSLCGLELPRTLIAGNVHNEDGYWESDVFRARNEALLAALDSAWDDPLASRLARDGRYPRADVEAIKTAVREEFSSGSDVIIKDPRISLVFGAWREALEDLGYEPVLIIPVRHPLEVAASLNKRDGFPIIKSVLLWLSHLLAIERDSRGLARAFVAYDDLLADWRGAFRRVERVTGLRLPHWTAAAELEIDQFLSPDRRHHRYDAALLDQRADLPWAGEAYRWALEAARADAEPSPAALNDIAAQFHATADIYAPMLAFERDRAEGRTPRADGASERLAAGLYYAAAGAPFSEDACLRLGFELFQAPRTLSLVTPESDQPLTALRLDPSDKPGHMVLYELRVRTPEGEMLWRWDGKLDLFSPELGVESCVAAGRAGAVLGFTNNDPQIHLPIGGALAGRRQVAVEITASLASAIDVALLKDSSRQRQLDELGRRIETRLGEVDAQLKAQAADMESIRGELGANVQQIADPARLGELDAQLKAQTADMESMRRELGARLHHLAAALGAQRQDLDARLAELSAAQEAMRAELGAHVQQLAAAIEAGGQRTAEMIRSDIRPELARAVEYARQANMLAANADAAAETRAARAEAAAEARATQAEAAAEARGAELGRGISALAEETRAIARQIEADRAARDLEAALRQEVAENQHARESAAYLAKRWQSEAEALRASTSWRLTAPLRALAPRRLFASAKGVARNLRDGARRTLSGPPRAQAPIAPANASADARLLAASTLFDPVWYRAEYADVAGAGVDPLEHYLHYGAFEGRAPGPWFDSKWYLAQNPDVQAAGVNPLVHYLRAGRREGRAPLPPGKTVALPLGAHLNLLGRPRHWVYLGSAAALAFEGLMPTGLARQFRRRLRINAPPVPETAADGGALFGQLFSSAVARSDEYVPLAPAGEAPSSRIRTIAFYLPQFHPIPENDAWWGKGFTEWTNVSKAVPQFVGHYQPRLPDELGFYDLRLLDVQRRQVELAKQYGVGGFCFHYYWFTGRKRLLERPLDQFLAAKDIDFPFCVCWANENWTRRWDGMDQEILMEQRHEPQDDLQFIEDLAPVLRDPRYIRIDGRPLIIVYRVGILPDPQRTTQVWRDYCRANGLGDPYLVAAQTFGLEDPRPFGFDAAVEFPPHKISTAEIQDAQRLINPDFSGRVFSYPAVARQESNVVWPDYTLFKTVMPSWDNEARKPGKGHAFTGSTPEIYKGWLEAACRATDERRAPSEKIVFINAWNEWAEGAYLEPDRRFGYAYLQATREALASFPGEAPAHVRAAPRPWPPLYVVAHAFYPEVFGEMLGYVRDFPASVTLIATCPPDRAEAVRAAYAQSGLACPFELIEVDNRGRDVLAFLEALRRADIPEDAVVLKVHTKVTKHRLDGSDWRRTMLDSLMLPQVVSRVLDAFASRERLQLVAPDGYIVPLVTFIGENQPHIDALLRRGGWAPIAPETDVFAAGTMFFIRRRMLEAVLKLGLTADVFEDEAGQKDGTVAHALERLFTMITLREGGEITDTGALMQGRAWAPNAEFGFAVKTPYMYQARN